MIPKNRSYVVMPSLGLGYIASVLRESGHDVKILHCLKENQSFEEFANYIKKNKFDIIGIQMFTFDITPVKKYLNIIEKVSPKTISILGGYHASGDKEGILEKFPNAKFALTSEVEIAFPKLLGELEKNKPNLKSVPNLIWRKEQKIKINPIKVVEDLDTIPFPAWDLMDPREYPETPHGGFFKSFPTAPIIITRGCPMECTFCAGKSITTNRIRKRSVKNVIEEIKFLKRNYNVNDFLIEDENFTVHKTLVHEFCDALIKQRLNITWSCPSGVRLDTLDLEMLRHMQRAGCHSLSIGIEFGSQRIHEITKKHLTLKTIKEKVALFKHVDIQTTGFFMFGIPTETKQEMLQTIKFAKSLDIDRAQFNNFMPLPGSEIYERFKKQGMKEVDYNHFFVHDVGYVPKGITRKEMKNIQRKAYIGFYLRPKIIIGLLKQIISVKQFIKLFKRFLDGMK